MIFEFKILSAAFLVMLLTAITGMSTIPYKTLNAALAYIFGAEAIITAGILIYLIWR